MTISNPSSSLTTAGQKYALSPATHDAFVALGDFAGVLYSHDNSVYLPLAYGSAVRTIPYSRRGRASGSGIYLKKDSAGVSGSGSNLYLASGFDTPLAAKMFADFASGKREPPRTKSTSIGDASNTFVWTGIAWTPMTTFSGADSDPLSNAARVASANLAFNPNTSSFDMVRTSATGRMRTEDSWNRPAVGNFSGNYATAGLGAIIYTCPAGKTALVYYFVVNSSAVVGPGVMVLQAGGFTMDGGAPPAGNGVTFLKGTVPLASGETFRTNVITASTSGSYVATAFVQERDNE